MGAYFLLLNAPLDDNNYNADEFPLSYNEMGSHHNWLALLFLLAVFPSFAY